MNRARARTVMAEHGLDALIATTTENFAYLTGMQEVDRLRQNWLSRYWAVLPAAAGAPRGMLVPRIHLQYAAQAGSAVDIIRSYGDYSYALHSPETLTEEEQRLVTLREPRSYADPFDALAALLAEMGLGGARRIGVDERMLSRADFATLEQKLPQLELVEAHEHFRSIRKIKTAEEIAVMRRALVITIEAMEAAIAAIKVGRPQAEAYEALRLGMARHNLHARNITAGVGPKSIWAFAQPSERLTQQGDIIKFDHGGVYQGYWTDWGRSGTVGEPAPEVVRRYAALLAGQQAGIAHLKPGVTAADIAGVVERTAREAGLSDYSRPAHGHGIGREIYDFPSISHGDTTVIEAGMVINVEAPLYELGWGGLQIEDTLVVTETGAAYLADYSRELFVAG